MSRHVWRVAGFVILAAGLGLTLGGCPAPSNNQAPVAVINPSTQTVTPGAAVTLDGSSSHDPDGDSLSFQWTQVSGTAVTLINPSTAVTTFTAPSTAGALVFRLTVNDGRGLAGSADATVNVSSSGGGGAPTVSAGADQSVTGGATVTLSGSGSDPSGGPVTFLWTQVSGTSVTLTNPDTATATFTAPQVSGALTFRLTVATNHGTSASDDTTVSVTVPEVLFISNLLGKNIVGYVNPSTINGNITPNTNLAGAQTLLNTPADIVVDKNGAMLVADFTANAILVFDNGATANGNFAPNRNVSGAATGLVGPVSLAIDPNSDTLFVANRLNNTITVYANVSTAAFNGNLAPTRTFASPGTINLPAGINLDAAGTLYVANEAGLNILAYANAINLNGNIAPTRILTSAAFVHPFDVYIDPQDRMYVANLTGGTVDTFQNASTLNGPVTPNFTLTIPGATGLTSIAVDSANTAWVVDETANKVYSYDNIASLNGTIAPPRTISGANTQFGFPIRVFLLQR